jgi:hypothetical protein
MCVALAGALHAGRCRQALADKTRRPGKPPLATTVIERVVALTAMIGQGTSQARATLRSSPK